MHDITERSHDPGETFLNLIQEQINRGPIKNTEMGRTLKQIDLDSLDMVEIVMSLEEELGIEITDEDAEKITGVNGSNTVFQAKNEIDALVVRRQKTK